MCRQLTRATAEGTLAPATGSRAEYRAGHVAGLEAAAGVKPIDSHLFESLLAAARAHPRRRRMVDLTREPATNQLQNLVRLGGRNHGDGNSSELCSVR